MPMCKWVRPRLVAFLLGELPGWHARLLAAHVGKCTACLAELDALRQTASVAVLASPRSFAPRRPVTIDDKDHFRTLVQGVRTRSHRLEWVYATAGAVAVVVFLAWQLAAPPLAGKVVRLSGHPQMRVAQQAWQPLTVGAAIPLNASLQTGEMDRVTLELTDGTWAQLDFGGDLALPPGTETRPDLHLQSGSLWILATPSKSSLRIHTEAGVVETLGTFFEVSAHTRPGAAPHTEVTVWRGSVQVKNAQGSVIIPAENSTTTYAGRAPETPQRITHLATVQHQLPWGQTGFEVWVMPPLEPGEAAHRLMGERGWLGLDLASAALTPSGEACEGPGVTVKRVAPHSPAARAGVVAGDRLLRIGDISVAGPGNLWQAELRYLPKHRVSLVFIHNDREQQAQVTCQEYPGKRPRRSAALEMANRAFAAGNLTDAKQQYASLAATDPAAEHNLGVMAEMEGQLETAYTHYQSAAHRETRDPRTSFSMAMVLARLGNPTAARRELETTLAREANFPGARYFLGRTLGFLGDDSAAQEQVDRLCAAPETKAQGLCLAGELARYRGELEGALPWYQQAEATDPLWADPPAYLGITYYLLNKFDPALLWTEHALIRDPQSIRALNCQGLIHAQQKQWEDAEANFLRVRDLSPDDALVYTNLGTIYLEQGHLESAKAAYEQAAELIPDGAYAHLGLAMTLEKMHRYTEAKAEYYQVIETLDPTLSEAYQQLAQLHRKLGEMQAAKNVESIAHRYGCY